MACPMHFGRPMKKPSANHPNRSPPPLFWTSCSTYQVGQVSEPFRLAVEIWGSRGSVATPGSGTLRYGGNTTCISVRSASGDRIIVDAGTGIRKLARQLPVGVDINLILTHFHWDHIQGLPFFSPLIQGTANICFHAGVPACETRAHLERQMSDPFFTLVFKDAKANCEFLQSDLMPPFVAAIFPCTLFR